MTLVGSPSKGMARKYENTAVATPDIVDATEISLALMALYRNMSATKNEPPEAKDIKRYPTLCATTPNGSSTTADALKMATQKA